MSDEPGFYKDGAWGIRIESDLVTVPAEGLFGSSGGGGGGKQFLRFEYVTKVPMCRRLIDEGLLSPEEVSWLNAYHDDCRSALTPRLSHDPRALAWLERETTAITTTATAATSSSPCTGGD